MLSLFARPDLLYLLALVPILILLRYVAARRQRQRLHRLFQRREVLNEFRLNISPLKTCLLIAASVLLVIAAAGPMWGAKQTSEHSRGGQIFVALDLSRSMLAEDISGGRLSFAKRKIIDLLNMLKGDRVALIAFAGTAFLQCPLTADYGAAEMFLEFMDPQAMPVQGTSFLAALRVAQESLKTTIANGGPADAALMIMSDGEDHDSNAESELKSAVAQGMKVFLIGVGTLAGAPIRIDSGELLRDANGEVVSTKLEEESLRSLAEKTGAVYIRATATDADWEQVYQRGIRGTLTESTSVQQQRRHGIERSFWFAFCGIVLLCLQYLLGGRVGTIVVLLATAIAAKSPDAFANPSAERAMRRSDYAAAEKLYQSATKANPNDYLSWYNQGVAAFRQQKFAESSSAFSKASQSSDPNLKADALYNLGNAEAYAQNFDGAIAAYEEALKIRSDDPRTKENLDYVRKMKEQKQKDQKDQKDKNDDKNQSEDKKEKEDKDGESEQKDEEKKDSSDQDQKDQQQKDTKDQEQKDKSDQNDQSDKSPKEPSAEELEKEFKKQEANRILNLAPDQLRQPSQNDQSSPRVAPSGKAW
jgi:Ca-activated chloride channel family protein